MNQPKMLIIAASLAFGGVAYAAAPAAKPAVSIDASNPFAKPSTLPFQYPAFDKIKNEHFAPAYAEGMRQQTAEIEKIANNKSAPTFDNT
ncbi:MAG: dipeptidyl carboxypeptidase II, partial [Telluria sp.]